MASTEPTDWRQRITAGLDAVAAGFERRVEIDLRALAAFRIGLGSLIVLDLLLRTRDFTAFYTNDGVLPTKALYSDYTDVHSLHAWLGEWWLVALLFVVAAAVGVALVVGYRTRTVTLISFLLLFSLHNRNPMVLNGGDILFRLLVFWAIFLPLGERWSIDARRIDRERSSVATMATFAVLAQIVIMYVSNFVHKTNGQDWIQGKAVAYILHLDQFSVFLGPYLAEYTGLLKLFTWGWLFLMALSPFLFVLTGWPRAVVATGFMGMHLGMLVTMQIAIFPLVVVVGLLLFYQAPIWDWFEAVASRFVTADGSARGPDLLGTARRSVSGAGGSVASRLPTASLNRLPRIPYPAEIPGVRPTLSMIIPAVFIALIIMSNAHALGYTAEPPEQGQTLLDKTDTDQSWQLFAPNPLKDTRWFVAEATLANGETVDAFTGGNVTFDRPPNAADRAGTARWRKYLANMFTAGNENHQSYFSNYLCGKWNRSHDVKMESVELHGLHEEETPFGPDVEIQRTRFSEYDCSGPFVQD
ncbi:HTTM domain-containing protein [Salinarchaeum laminariae]|uniref:HTTM domain-containing protein n=1 Tax=Salinarchaeum laminariae TaxID=869888 RepID=UPI0020BE82B8|nr:HTTM domain-containing protein [Salinarchaeum laminariae]